MKQHHLRIAFASVLALGLSFAGEVPNRPIDFSYQQAQQTVLNRNGGPWAHLDLMTLSADELRSHVQSYTVNGKPFTVGPVRLVHAFICLNPVGIDYNHCSDTNPNPHPITADDVKTIDAALAKVQQSRVKIILRFAYNHGTGDDAPLDVILQDIQSLAPLVHKYKNVIYAMNAGFIGFWGEGHDSTNGNNTPDNMRQIMQAEQQAFGDATFMLNRQPANILSWEIGPAPYWGVHDDHYATGQDAGTWLSHPWDNGSWTSDELKAFASTRSDLVPFSGEIGGIDQDTQTCEAFDAYSKMLRLNMMNIGFHTDFLVTQSCFPDLVNKIGPAISLTRATLSNPHMSRGTSLTLTFRNTGYSRLFSQVPMFFVLADSTGQRVPREIFEPVMVPFDLRQLAAADGEGSITVNIEIPEWLRHSKGYSAALWMPDADPTLAEIPEYNYLLNNQKVPNPDTGLNILFPIGRSLQRQGLSNAR